MEQAEYDDLDTAGVLAEISRVRSAQATLERDRLLLVAHFADLHNADGLLGDPDAALPGRDAGIRLGGSTTPLVRELAIGELSAELGRSTYSTRQLLGNVLELRHRLPRLWNRVLNCEVETWLACKVAQATKDLTPEQAAFVDAEVSEYADGRLPAGRFLDLLAGKVVAADPEGTAEKERKAAAERFAKVGHSNQHGQRTLYVKTSAAEVARIDATIAYLADALAALGDRSGVDDRRAKAVLILANPVAALTLLQATNTHRSGFAAEETPLADDEGDSHDDPAEQDRPDRPGTAPESVFRRFRPDETPACTCQGGRFTWDPGRLTKLLPTVTLYLHAQADTVRSGRGVVRWEGEGPVTADYLRRFLGPNARFVVKEVIDLAGQAPVDAYEIPDKHREAVQLRSPADVFPWGTNTGRQMDLDHTRAYESPDTGGPPGQTHPANLGPLTRYHHRIKTHAGWDVRQPFDGIFVWKSPHGAIYLVDQTGTRQLRATQAA